MIETMSGHRISVNGNYVVADGFFDLRLTPESVKHVVKNQSNWITLTADTTTITYDSGDATTMFLAKGTSLMKVAKPGTYGQDLYYVRNASFDTRAAKVFGQFINDVKL